MLKSFGFRTPEWILFGVDAVSRLGIEAKRLGAGRVMIITDQGVAKAGLVDRITDPLKKEGIDFAVFDQVEPEPPIHNLLDSVKMAREGKFDVFVGLGGGSSMDTTKLTSAMMTNKGDIQDFFGVDNVPKRGLPTIMITTTSGTGSEVTRMAVFTDTDANLKKVVSAQNILADVAIVDPSMTTSMPPGVTASTGIDAFIHAVESYINSRNANPFTDAIALESIGLIAKSLGPAYANGRHDIEARYNMALGSVTAGIALNNAGVGHVHALAYPIGAEYHLAHGIALIVVNEECMRSVAMSNLPKFRKIAEIMGINVSGFSQWEAAEAAIEGMTALAKSVNLPTTLTDVGGDKSKIQEWAEAAYGERRLLGNTPRDLTVDDIVAIFTKSF